MTADTSRASIEALSDDLQLIARALPDNVSKDTCGKINEGGEVLRALIELESVLADEIDEAEVARLRTAQGAAGVIVRNGAEPTAAAILLHIADTLRDKGKAVLTKDSDFGAQVLEYADALRAPKRSHVITNPVLISLEAADESLILAALEDVHDMDVTLPMYAASVARAIRALPAMPPVVKSLVEALRAAITQLRLVHDDAFKQCGGLDLCRSDGKSFSCYQINRCDEAAAVASLTLAAYEASHG